LEKFGALWKDYQLGFVGNFFSCHISFPDMNLRKVPEMGICTVVQIEQG
jgi:hypothetical protein